jgi:hypothetical protein
MSFRTCAFWMGVCPWLRGTGIPLERPSLFRCLESMWTEWIHGVRILPQATEPGEWQSKRCYPMRISNLEMSFRFGGGLWSGCWWSLGASGLGRSASAKTGQATNRVVRSMVSTLLRGFLSAPSDTPRNSAGTLDRTKWLQGAPVCLKPAMPISDWPLEAPRIAGRVAPMPT